MKLERSSSAAVLIFFVSFLASRQDNEKPLRLEQEKEMVNFLLSCRAGIIPC